MAERSMDTTDTSTGLSVGTQTASSESLPMEELCNNIRGMNSKLDMVVSRLDDIERQRGTRNEERGTRNEELVSSIKVMVQTEMAFFTNKINDSFRANMKTTQTRLEETIGSRIEGNKEAIFMKIDGAVGAIKENTYRAKREIFAVTEKEAQLVRDYKAGLRPVPAFHSYSFDFYVEDFGYLVSSGRKVHSLPWQINQFKSCVVGKVQFLLEDKMEIWMVYGRDPRRVGFRPNYFTSQIEVRVTATIIACRDNQDDKTVGSETWCMNEEDMVDSEEKGVKLGEVPCMELVTLGYAKHENNSVLVRYDVKIE